tara:strand:- start:4910 stop:5974 length:1065 start_codon:yes stop_codon:yes gene_type:complete
MAFTTINKSSDHFKAIKYTGTGSSNAITGVGHQPDFLWIKTANGAEHHILIDAVRGLDKQMYSSHSSSQDTNAQSVTAVGADGFTVGTNAQTNANSSIFIAQTWKAGGGAGSSNTDGTINTISTSVNTTAGISISTYTGNATQGATVGHGLGVAPKAIIIKSYTNSEQWVVGHNEMNSTNAWDYYMHLQSNAARGQNNNRFGNVYPTNQVFTLGSEDQVNSSSKSYVAYCFAEKKGFSKFGTYKGNGSSDGLFIYTGFKPAWLMTKYAHSGGTGSWLMYNTGLNPTNKDQFFHHEANTTNTWVDNTDRVDFYSNGFKFVDSTNSDSNTSGGYYVYMAFAEAPFVGTNNIPATAR